MSSIFRSSYDDDWSADSIGSTENEMSEASGRDNHGSTNSIPRRSLDTPMALARLSLAHPQLPNIQPHQHSTLFYLSLIEGRCRTQAASALNAGRRLEDHLPEHHPEVHGLAQHLFGEMTKELHKAGVLPDEFAGQELSELRRNYLSSFDAILHNVAAKKSHQFQDNNTYSSLFERSNGYTLEGELLSKSFSDSRAFALQRYTMATSSTQQLISSFPALTLGDNEYKKKYNQICELGRGGFGKVYKALNNLDKCEYAIKKVVIQGDTLSQTEGKAEELLAELRVLARLNHPNIVRYHHSWAEIRPSNRLGDSSSSQSGDENEDGQEKEEERTEASNSSDSSTSGGDASEDVSTAPGIPIFKDHKKNALTLKKKLEKESRHMRRISDITTQDNIVFERSASSTKSTIASHGRSSIKDGKELVNLSFFRSGNSPNNTDSEDEGEAETKYHKVLKGRRYAEDSTEEVPRSKGVSKASDDGVDLVLFIQMALHPMNLDDYLWPGQQKSDETPQIEHCYHTVPTARILLGILDGVEFIHDNQIVHRDLKPSNIMLSISKKAVPRQHGYIKVSDCEECNKRDGRDLYLIPHIGDFGLVADIQDTETGPSPALTPNTALISKTDSKFRSPALSQLSSRQPGTRFYCAPKSLTGKTIICPKVDVYSLGVIALEMIYRFSTKAERAFELEKLRDGVFPPGFEGHEMADGIKQMLREERNDRWGCADVRDWLKSFIEKGDKGHTSEKA